MIVVDAHQDIAYNAYTFNRDYTLPVYKKRQLEPKTSSRNGPGIATLGLPDALLGRVAIVFATIYVVPDGLQLTNYPEPFYRDAQEAYDRAIRQMDYYERLAGEHDLIQLIKTASDLDAVLETWGDDVPLGNRIQGLVILMEGADPIIEPKQFEEWYDRGVRIVGPAWSQTRYAGGTGAPGPLTDLGMELLEVLADTGTILDVSHLTDEGFHQALDRYEGTIIASHSNPRRFRDSERHLSDDMIRKLAERDGVMGIVTYNNFLHKTWRYGDRRSRVPFTTVIDVIDHVCQVTGSAQHVGLGSDLDGGFGLDSLPSGMDNVGDLWHIGSGLRKRGYDESDIEAILAGNFLRKLRESLPRG